MPECLARTSSQFQIIEQEAYPLSKWELILQTIGSNTLNYNAAAEDLDKELEIKLVDLEEREEKAAVVCVLSQVSDPHL